MTPVFKERWFVVATLAWAGFVTGAVAHKVVDGPERPPRVSFAPRVPNYSSSPDVASKTRPTPPLPASEWGPLAQLTLKRAVFGEGGTDADAAAIPWAMLRRWRLAAVPGRTYEEQVRAYCSPTRPELASWRRLHWARETGDAAEVRRVLRRRAVQTLILGEPPLRDFRYAGEGRALARERWLRVQEIVDAWGRGLVQDPCPGADHWDEPRSVPRVRRLGWARVQCTAQTGNVFYRSRAASMPTPGGP